MTTLQQAFDALLAQLENVKETANGETRANCPVCGDTGQHLYTRIGDKTILLYCQRRGCRAPAILEKLGLPGSDLYETDESKPTKSKRKSTSSKRTVQTYDYVDEAGKLLHQTIRYDPKDFSQRRPDGKGGWIYDLECRRVLYHLPDVLAAAPGQAVFVCEGEKSADAIRGLGVIATCNPMGAGKWSDDYIGALAGKAVVILPDADDAGKEHGYLVSRSLYGKAESVRVLNLPDLQYRKTHGDDPFDWVQRGGDLPGLVQLVAKTPYYGPETGTWADMAERVGPIAWTWPRWLPCGMLTILAGEPGRGKSALALRIAGCFVRGDRWPDGCEYTDELGKVLWCEAEAAQAVNLERAKSWGLPLDRLLTPFTDPLKDIQLDDPEQKAIVESLAYRADVRMVVVDSLRGAHRRDENSSESIDLVMWLAKVARDTNKPIILTHHLRKRGLFDSDQQVNLERIRGSSAIVQAARLVWALDAPDPNDPDAVRLSVIKNNLAQFPEPLGLRVNEAGVTFGNAPEAPKVETQLDQAIDALRALLDSGPMPVDDLLGELQGMGISEPTARRAKKHMGIISRKDADGWQWGLPARVD